MSKSPIVTIKKGQLQGSYEARDTIAVFKGIPFAQPPVGPLRWQPPRPFQPWDGLRLATKHAPIAHQRATEFKLFFDALLNGQGIGLISRTLLKTAMQLAPQPKQSEDCLYLNIRTPSLDRLAKLPVMVWIHGGDHQDGSSIDPFYLSNALPERDIVLVTINYRLGLFGFFTHPELSQESDHNVSGNYGLLDQIMALQWVQENITSFGGDPDNVTIFGESAGGESVAHLLTIPLARGLFHKAILQSPANAAQMLHLKHPFKNFPTAEERGLTFAAKAGVTGPNQLAQLRTLAADQLQAIVRQHPGHISAFYPVIDGYTLPQSPFTTFYEGTQAAVPLLLGCNADEGSLIFAMFRTPLVEYADKPMTPEHIPTYLREAFGNEAQTICEQYPGIENADRQAMSDLLGDSMFNARTRFYAEKHTQISQPAYLYQLTRVAPSRKQTIGAFHGVDLPFVHGSRTPVFPMTSDDHLLSHHIITYWTQFAKTADPNHDSLPTWTPFTPDAPQWMILDHQLGMQPVTHEAKYAVLNGRLQHQIQLMQGIQ